MLAPSSSIANDWELIKLPNLNDRREFIGEPRISYSLTPDSSLMARESPHLPSSIIDNIGISDVVASSPPSSADMSSASSPPVVVTSSPSSFDTQQVVETLGCGQRPRIPSVKLKDYFTYNAIHLENSSLSHACSTSSSETFQDNSLYLLTDYISDKLFQSHIRRFSLLLQRTTNHVIILKLLKMIFGVVP